MALPNDNVISTSLNQILENVDLDTTSFRTLLSLLADKLGVHPSALNSKKTYIRHLIDAYFDRRAKAAAASRPSRSTSSTSRAHSSPTKRRAKRKTSAKAPQFKLSSLEKAVVLSQPLASFLGSPVLPLSTISPRIIAYATEHKVKSRKLAEDTQYTCDSELKEALGVDVFTTSQLASIVSSLVKKPSECNEDLQRLAAKVDLDTATSSHTSSSPRSKKRVKEGADRRGAGLQRPMKLSSALTAVCGEDMLPRGGVVKKIWSYIRENDLKDKDNPMNIRCDDKLKAIFTGRDTIVAMDVNKFIGAHMTKIS